jgi:hypothetical protein
MVIKTKYSINDKIYISELKIWGRILSIFVGGSLRTEYLIRYFDGKEKREIYFLEEELVLQEEEKKVGYVQ